MSEHNKNPKQSTDSNRLDKTSQRSTSSDKRTQKEKLKASEALQVSLEQEFMRLENLWSVEAVDPPQELFEDTLELMGLDPTTRGQRAEAERIPFEACDSDGRGNATSRKSNNPEQRLLVLQGHFARAAGIAAALLIVISMSWLAHSSHVASGQLHLAEISNETWQDIMQESSETDFYGSLQRLDDLLQEPSPELALLDTDTQVETLEDELDAFFSEIDRF